MVARTPKSNDHIIHDSVYHPGGVPSLCLHNGYQGMVRMDGMEREK